MLILFDVDGTLLLSGGAGLKAMATAARRLHGDAFTFDGVDFAGRLDPLIWHDAARANGVDDPAAYHEAFRAAYAEALEAHFATDGAAWALPGVAELVARLAATDGVTLGLLTGNYAETGCMKLRAAGLDPDDFPVTAWGSDGPTRRDLPPVAIERWRAVRGGGPAASGDVVIIGDTPHDIDCARAHDCLAIAVATGPAYDRAALEATAPDLLLDDLQAVDEITAWLYRRRAAAAAAGRAT